MPLTVEQIMTRALVLLKDKGAVRWPVPELLGWLNEGVRYAVSMKPDLAVQRVTIPLAAGVDQTVPDTINRIVRFSHNANTGIAITPTTRQLMDAYVPGWHGNTLFGQRPEIRHVVVDEADHRSFSVVPANNGSGSIVVLASMRLTDIEPAAINPQDLASYAAVDSPLEDAEGDALVDYLVYRAASKDADLPGMAQRAAQHYSFFANRLGIEVQSEMKVRPETPAPDPTV